MIIHISGSSGSGKTTIGNKIKKMFGNKVAVFDVDDLHMNPLNSPKYWNELNKTKTITEAKKVWKKLIHKTISETIKKNIDPYKELNLSRNYDENSFNSIGDIAVCIHISIRRIHG